MNKEQFIDEFGRIYKSYLRVLSDSEKCAMSPKEYGMTLQGKKKKKVKK